MRKAVILVLVYIGFIFLAFTQFKKEKLFKSYERSNEIQFKSIVSWQVLRNEIISESSYNGSAVGLGLGLNLKRDDYIFEVDLTLLGGGYRNKKIYGSNFIIYNGHISLYFGALKKTRFKLFSGDIFLGSMIENTFEGNLITPFANSRYNFLTYSFMGPLAHYNRNIRFKDRNWQVGGGFGIGLFGYWNGTNNNDILRQNNLYKFVYIGKLVGLRSNLHIKYIFSKANGLILYYTWKFTHINNSMTVSRANHLLGIAFKMNL